MSSRGPWSTHDGVAERRARRVCPSCGGELRFSHREYVRGGQSADVRVCAGCGDAVRSATTPRAAQERTGARRPPVDEGPPVNTVLDGETAARILGGLDPS